LGDRVLVRGHYYLCDRFNKHLRRACEAAEVPRFTAKGLRKLATDLVLDAGFDAGVEAALLGHSAQTAVKHYRLVRSRTLRAAVDATGMGDLSGLRPAAQVLPFVPKPAQNPHNPADSEQRKAPRT
jgi:hypothetical protein